MIARIWRGYTRLADREAYHRFLNETGMKDYLACRGNRGATLLCRDLPQEDKAEFVFISYWESLAAIQEFAGPEIEKAHYYPDDKRFLLDFEPTVNHYQVLEQQAPEKQ